jgi:MFS family permease
MQTRASLAAWYALGVLTMTTLYALIDRQILVLLTQPLKVDLHLSDGQIGSLLGVGSVLFAAIATIPLGWLSDKVDRRLLLAGCVLFWTGAVASCGLAVNFWSLLLCVSLLGVGEAGLAPIVYSLIPDLFSDQQRLTANFIFYSATVLGAGAGFAMSGAVIDHIGTIAHWFPGRLATMAPWRLAFMTVAVPGPFLALAIGTIRLRSRASKAKPAQSEQTTPAPPRSDFFPYLWSHWQAILGTASSFSLATLGAGAIFIWLPVTLMRRFGLSPGGVGAGLGVAIAVGAVAGLLIASTSANFLKSKWGDATPIRLPQIGFLIFLLVSPLYLVVQSATQVFVVVGIQMTANIAGSSLSPTAYQNLAPASLRGRIFSLTTVSATVVQTASPILVGLVSDHIFTHAANGLLLSSVAVGAPCMFLSVLVMRLAEKHVVATVREVQALSASL